MKKLLLILMILISSLYAQEYKAIYNLTSSKLTAYESSLLRGIPNLSEHYKANGDSLKVVVIISGGAYKFFRNDVNSELNTELLALVQSGVKFEVCSVGMKKRGLTKEQLYSFVTPVFNRTASLIEWQSKGYSLVNIE